MQTHLKPVAATSTRCKCCDATATLFGVVDFNRSCEDVSRPPVPLSGIPIYYYRCPQCGFLFTPALDDFSDEDFRREIYNQDYQRFDPEYGGARAQRWARSLSGMFASTKQLGILDYGSGTGTLAQSLRERGFDNVQAYDPFVPEFARRPSAKFDLIISLETVEHSPRPREIFDDMVALLADPGIILFSTLFQPDEIRRMGTSWWYIAPRNGHVSLFTPESVRELVKPHGLILGSQSDRANHVLIRGEPWFASALEFE
jgi:2-polyprenyl-6-hydroxyphenyl methylase/3-demethylubiquinone-9 3-methyltransferase